MMREKLQRARGWLKGRKTLWVSRCYVLAGILISPEVHDAVTTNLPGLQWINPKMWPLVLIGTGILFELLRHVTSGPPHYAAPEKDGENV